MTRDSRSYKSGLYEDFFDAASTDHLTVEKAVKKNELRILRLREKPVSLTR